MSEVQSPAVAEPGTSEAGWHPDPCGRYHYRYWDGNRWTAAVSFNGETKQDQIPVSAESGRDEDPSHTWIADSDLGGLYVLHVDHEAVAATSFVDRKLRLSEQLDALNAVDWPAAGHIEFVRRDIASGTMSTPFTGSLPGNRRLSPFATTNLAAVIDTGEEPSEHPVRRYCHPDLTTSGDLVLDSGEQVIATWKTFEPTLEACTADGSHFGNLAVPKTKDDLRDYKCVLTSHRVVFYGRVGEALAGPDDPIAAARQVARWATRTKPLYWVVHLRHEWISSLGYGNLPERKKPLLTKSDDTRFIFATCELPGVDRSLMLHLPFKQSKPTVEDTAETFVRAVAASRPHAAISGPTVSTRQVKTGAVFSSKKLETEATTRWTVADAVPWSMPPVLGSPSNTAREA